MKKINFILLFLGLYSASFLSYANKEGQIEETETKLSPHNGSLTSPLGNVLEANTRRPHQAGSLTKTHASTDLKDAESPEDFRELMKGYICPNPGSEKTGTPEKKMSGPLLKEILGDEDAESPEDFRELMKGYILKKKNPGSKKSNSHEDFASSIADQTKSSIVKKPSSKSKGDRDRSRGSAHGNPRLKPVFKHKLSVIQEKPFEEDRDE